MPITQQRNNLLIYLVIDFFFSNSNYPSLDGTNKEDISKILSSPVSSSPATKSSYIHNKANSFFGHSDLNSNGFSRTNSLIAGQQQENENHFNLFNSQFHSNSFVDVLKHLSLDQDDFNVFNAPTPPVSNTLTNNGFGTVLNSSHGNTRINNSDTHSYFSNHQQNNSLASMNSFTNNTSSVVKQQQQQQQQQQQLQINPIQKYAASNKPTLNSGGNASPLFERNNSSTNNDTLFSDIDLLNNMAPIINLTSYLNSASNLSSSPSSSSSSHSSHNYMGVFGPNGKSHIDWNLVGF